MRVPIRILMHMTIVMPIKMPFSLPVAMRLSMPIMCFAYDKDAEQNTNYTSLHDTIYWNIRHH